MSATPTQEYRRIGHEKPAKLHKGLDAKVNSFIGLYRRRGEVLNELLREAEKIDAQAAVWSEMSDHLLRQRLAEFRLRFHRGGRESKNLVTDSLAAIREVSDRQVGLRGQRVAVARRIVAGRRIGSAARDRSGVDQRAGRGRRDRAGR